jgi:hypothetical protein
VKRETREVQECEKLEAFHQNLEIKGTAGSVVTMHNTLVMIVPNENADIEGSNTLCYIEFIAGDCFEKTIKGDIILKTQAEIYGK